VIPTQQTFVEERVITSAPIVTGTTTNYTEYRQGLPLGTELGLGQQQFIGQRYESNLGNQGLLGGEFLGGQQFIGQNYETTSYTNQSSYGLGQNLGGLGLVGSQLPTSTLPTQGLTGLQGSTYPGGFNSGLIGTDPALIGTNPGFAGNSGLLASKTSALGAQGGFSHGYKRLGAATNAGWSERPGYTLGDVESNPTLQANLDTNGGGFFNKAARERRAEPYSLSNPGTYGIPHGQTIDQSGHLHPEIPLNRQAPIGQINHPGYTGYPDGATRGLNAGLPGSTGLLPGSTGLQGSTLEGSTRGYYNAGAPGYANTSLGGLQSGLNQGGLQSNLGQGLSSNYGTGLQSNLGQGGIQSGPNLGGLRSTLGQGGINSGPNLGGLQQNYGQGGLSGSRNDII